MEAEQLHEKEIVNQVSRILQGKGPDDFTFRLTTTIGTQLIEHPLFFDQGIWKTKTDIVVPLAQDCYLKKLEVQIVLMGDYKKWLDLPVDTNVQCFGGNNLILTFNDNTVVSLSYN